MKPGNKIFQRDCAGSRAVPGARVSIGGPDLIFAQVPFPNPKIDRLRGHTHPFFALTQRLVLVYQLSDVDT